METTKQYNDVSGELYVKMFGRVALSTAASIAASGVTICNPCEPSHAQRVVARAGAAGGERGRPRDQAVVGPVGRVGRL